LCIFGIANRKVNPMSDLTTSLKEIFNERISSPFYGSLIVSWLLWNWKILYVTFFIDQSRLGDATNKIDYILKHCDSPWYLAVFPLLSTAVIVLLMPYVTNGSSWVTERFDTWRINKKNEVQGKRLLTVEESLQLRIEIQNQEEKYSSIIVKKDSEILTLKQEITLLSKPKVSSTLTNKKVTLAEEFKVFLDNDKVSKYMEQVAEQIRTSYGLQNIPKEVLNYYEGYDIIEPSGSFYRLTEKGKYFLKEYLKQKISKTNSPVLYDKQSQVVK
jgi:hypothetical protein